MLTLYEPKYEDLWFRQMMLADEDTMSYNHAWGGTIPWPEDKWSGWYDYWIACHEDKRYYRYLKMKMVNSLEKLRITTMPKHSMR